MTDKGDNIVKLADFAPSLSVKRVDWTEKRARCKHRAISVWAKEPIVECRDCGAVVDPIQWIRDRCNDFDYLQAEKKRLESDIAALQESKKLARAAVRREREKAHRELDRQAMVLPPHVAKGVRP